MRLWTLHPRYLDPQGLVALWREALLAKAVLRGETRGYRQHPQLARFHAISTPLSAINAYLGAVHDEAVSRGYDFDRSKAGPRRTLPPIAVNDGQVAHEWQHLMTKLQARSPELFQRWRDVGAPELHPLFVLRHGPIEDWERVDARRTASARPTARAR